VCTARLGSSSWIVPDGAADRSARSNSPNVLARRPSERYRIRVEGCRRRLKLPPVGAAAQFNKHYPSAPLGIALLNWA